MSKALEKAEVQYRAGQYKRAADTLWEVSFGSGDGEAEAQAVVALATQLRDVTQGGVRSECEEHMARAERFLHPEAHTVDVLTPAEREFREDPVLLARRARDAGLTWLEIRRAEDVLAAEMRTALAAATAEVVPPPPSMIDSVEAEGWRLEHVTCLFRPTRVQTSVLRGAEFFMGGEVVDGDEHYLYLFRRVDGVSG
jgi:hypothetical protein